MKKTMYTVVALTAFAALGCEGRLNATIDGAPAVIHPEKETPSLGPGATVEDPADIPQPTDVDECAKLAPTAVADVPARLLTTDEVNNALATLFAGIDIDRVEMTSDTRVGSYVLNAREQVAATHVRDFRLMAEDVASAVASSIDDFAPCEADDRACASAAVTSLGTSAFRRPLTDTEQTGLMGLYDGGAADGAHAGGMRFVVEAVLQSPSFMYVTEDTSVATLTDFEIAQRMSAMLWRSIPDAELLAAADRGELQDAASREAHARRMLAQGNAASALRSLVLQWLGLDRLGEEAFADDALVMSMEAETRRLVDHVAQEKNSSWVELLTSDYTFIDATMAEHYGVDLVGAEEVSNGVFRVEIPERAGLLTQAGFLVLHHGPVHRGLAIRKAVLCGEVPGPTNVDTESIPTTATEAERSKSEKRLAENSCGGCHVMMDPLGLPMDQFGTLGQFRSEDQHGNSVDGSGEVVTVSTRAPVADAVEMAHLLTQVEETRECIAKNLFTWSFGRPPRPSDNCSVARVEATLLENEDNLQEALVRIIAHETFAQRAGGE